MPSGKNKRRHSEGQQTHNHPPVRLFCYFFFTYLFESVYVVFSWHEGAYITSLISSCSANMNTTIGAWSRAEHRREVTKTLINKVKYSSYIMILYPQIHWLFSGRGCLDLTHIDAEFCDFKVILLEEIWSSYSSENTYDRESIVQVVNGY